MNGVSLGKIRKILRENKDFYNLGSTMVVAYTVGATQSVLLAIYLRSLNFTTIEISLLVSIPGFAGILSGAISGRISDYIGRKPIIVIGLLGYSIPWVIFRLSTSRTSFYVGRIVDGVTLTMFFTGIYAFIADVFHKEKRGMAMGVFQSLAGIGMTLGPILHMGLIYDKFGWNGYCTVSILIFVVSGSLVQLFVKESKPEHGTLAGSLEAFRNGLKTVKRSIQIPNLQHFRIRSPVTLLLIALVINALGQTMITPLFPIYLLNLGISVPEMSVLFSLTALVTIVSPAIFGKLSDRIGRKKVLISMTMVSGVAMLMFPQVRSFTLILVVRSFTSLGSSVVAPVGLALLSDFVPSSRRGTGIGIYQTLLRFDTSVWGIVGGIVAFYCGFDTIFLVGFLAALASALMVSFLVEEPAGSRT